MTCHDIGYHKESSFPSLLISPVAPVATWVLPTEGIITNRDLNGFRSSILSISKIPARLWPSRSFSGSHTMLCLGCLVRTAAPSRQLSVDYSSASVGSGLTCTVYIILHHHAYARSSNPSHLTCAVLYIRSGCLLLSPAKWWRGILKRSILTDHRRWLPDMERRIHATRTLVPAAWQKNPSVICPGLAPG